MKKKRKWYLWFIAYLIASYISAVSILLVMMIMKPDSPDWTTGYIAVSLAPLLLPGNILFTLWGMFQGHFTVLDITHPILVVLLTKFIFDRLNKYHSKKRC